LIEKGEGEEEGRRCILYRKRDTHALTYDNPIGQENLGCGQGRGKAGSKYI